MTVGPHDEYGSPVVSYGSTGEVFHGNSAVDDVQVQELANGKPMDPDTLTGYHNHGKVDNPFHHEAGRFLVNKPGKTVYHAQARSVTGTGIAVLQTCRIAGINFVETSGAASATVVISQGIDGMQQPLLYINLAANESQRDMFPLAIQSRGGVYVTITGSAKGILFTEESHNV